MSEELTLFDIGPDWKDHWWGMPEFEVSAHKIAAKKLVVNFPTTDDYNEFVSKNNLSVAATGGGTSNAWFPSVESKMKDCYYDGGNEQKTRYPICIPSKGRAKTQITGKRLDRMGLDYVFFVEEKEADIYISELGKSKVHVMPFSDLGQGSIPARNYIWEWALKNGHARHWIIDDNIGEFARLNFGARRNYYTGAPLVAIEDFVDRYENIAIAGPHGKGFVMDHTKEPIKWNSRVYSCSLIDTSLPHRWRGKYNEDTDLCLRFLKDGYCTALFNAFLIQKAITAGAKGKAMAGGNTDNVYNTGDHRRAFAESLKEQHPDCVEVVWKFNRWHHQVNYSQFAKNKPILKDGIVPRQEVNEYGMEVRKRK